MLRGVRKFLVHRFRRPTLTVMFCGALLLGIACAREPWLGWTRGLIVLAVFVVATAWRQTGYTLLALVLTAFGLGVCRGSLYATKVQAYNGLMRQKVVLIGRAQVDAVYGSREQLSFSMASVRVVQPYHKQLVGTITVSGFGAPAVFRGDDIQVSGKLYPTLGGNQAQVSFAELQMLSRHATWIDTVRQRFVAGMQSALPEPAASFGLGLLIGQRNTLPAAVSQQLTMVGLTHIIAVSGYNLTIMLQVARRLFGKRSKFQATASFVTLIGLFVLLTGSSPSIVRAAIVSLVSIAAWYYGRDVRPLVLLLLAAAITAFANPLYLWGNVSWYLSFLAFAGVLLLAPLIAKRFLPGREPGIILAILVESLCAEALTVPYVLHTFRQLSLVALPANLLIVPLVPLAMLLSLAAGLAGMLAPAIAGWLALPAQYLLTYMLDATHLLSRVPHAFVQHVGFSLEQMLISYGIIVCVGLILSHRPQKML